MLLATNDFHMLYLYKIIGGGVVSIIHLEGECGWGQSETVIQMFTISLPLKHRQCGRDLRTKTLTQILNPGDS